MDADGANKRHCWECLRRRLVCDFTRPACQRCSQRGATCPGYDEEKPLRWLESGKVKSRKQRLEWTPSSFTADADADTSTVCGKRKKHQQQKRQPKLTFRPNEPNPEDEEQVDAVETGTGSGVATGEKDDVSKEIIPRFDITTEFDGIVQAVGYFNACIYREMLPMQALGHNPHIYALSAQHFRDVPLCPDHLVLNFVCMALGHRMLRVAISSNQGGSSSTREIVESTKKLNAAYYRYRCLAIQSLNEDLGVKERRESDFVLAGVLMVFLVDAQHGIADNWQYHVQGFEKILKLRGGLRRLANVRGLWPSLLCFLSTTIFSNTTSSAPDIFSTQSHLDDLNFVIHGGGRQIFTLQMCPPQIILEMATINHLRHRAFAINRIDDGDATIEEMQSEAQEILQRISQFSAENWAYSKPALPEGWITTGRTYQAALTLYHILSLQSISVLPTKDPSLRAVRSASAKALHTFLIESMASLSIKRFMVWPLIVLGVESADSSVRAFVLSSLEDLSCYVGTMAPLMAGMLLERFWAKGATTWDECFETPHACVTQIAVDIEGLISVSPAERAVVSAS